MGDLSRNITGTSAYLASSSGVECLRTRAIMPCTYLLRYEHVLGKRWLFGSLGMFVCILRKLDSIEKALTSSGEKASGAETTLLSIIEAMLVHGMIVKGRSERMHYGTAAVGFPKRNELNLCRKLGRDVAGLVTMLLAGIVFTPFS